MAREHTYTLTVKWTGNTGNGTADYKAYERSLLISAENKVDIKGSSDPAFRGDSGLYNSEDLLVASLSSCHMLWFLHFCADRGIIVTAYTDQPRGTMVVERSGAGRFTEVVLHPSVSVSGTTSPSLITELHEKAHQYCFIANSVNFPVRFESTLICD